MEVCDLDTPICGWDRYGATWFNYFVYTVIKQGWCLTWATYNVQQCFGGFFC